MSAGALGVAVLAAGRGTRMRSAIPKVLHPVCGLPMAAHVIEAALALEPARLVVVVGHESDRVKEGLARPGVEFIQQSEQLGTADAVRRCEAALAGCDPVLVLNGDSPLVEASLLRELLARLAGYDLAFVTAAVTDAGRLGRVQRTADGLVSGIVEAADYRGSEAGGEINAGQYAFRAGWLWDRLARVATGPSGEAYLTDLPAIAHAEGRAAATVEGDADVVLGVDDRWRLAEAERAMRRRILRNHALAGVTLIDPETTYIDATVHLEADVTVRPACHLLGKTRVAAGSEIGPGTTLRDATIGERTRVESSVIEQSSIGRGCTVGPFAHVRGDALIDDECELGNYAEVKNSRIGRGVKMHHFSYVGDADVGEGTNIAAGTITCNFDGVQKHRTTIGRNVFIGSDTMLVAPVSVGDGAMTAAGSVVIRDVPPGGRVAGVPARPLPGGGQGPERDGG